MGQNSLDIEFADGEYFFALPIARIQELQTKCGIGIGALFARVLRGCVPIDGQIMLTPGLAEFYATDIVETIRQGLIGGGRGVVNGEEVKVTPPLANRLIEAYVLDRPLIESWSLAASILAACIVGYDPPKKDAPATERANPTPKEDSTTDLP